MCGAKGINIIKIRHPTPLLTEAGIIMLFARQFTIKKFHVGLHKFFLCYK